MLNRLKSLLILVLASVLLSCSNANVTVTMSFGPAASLSISQVPSSVVSGNTFSVIPIISEKDAQGRLAKASYSLVYVAAFADSACMTAASGTLSTSSFMTSAGIGSLTNVSYSGPAGIIYLGAQSGSIPRTCSSAIDVVVAGPAAKLAFTVEPPSAAQVGVMLAQQPVVQIEDASGNLVSSATNSVALNAYSDVNCTTQVPGPWTAAANPLTATAGVAAFSGITYSGAVANYYIKATASGLTSACSSQISFSPGPAANLAFQTAPATFANSGSPFAPQPVVNVVDVGGNLVTSAGQQVVLQPYTTSSCSTLAGSLSGTSSLFPTLGQAAFANVYYSGSPGVIYVGASYLGLTSICSPVSTTITAGAASKLAFIANPPSNITAGSSFISTPVVQVEDSGGSLVPTATNPITLGAFTTSACSTPDSGTISGTPSNTINATSGVAVFNTGMSITYNGSSPTIYIGATAPGLSTACYGPVTVIVAVGLPTQVVFTQVPPLIITSGLPFPAEPVIALETATSTLATTATNLVTLGAYSDVGCNTADTGGMITGPGTSEMDAVGGVLDFPMLSYTGNSPSIYLGATSGGLTTACYGPITIVPATPIGTLTALTPPTVATGSYPQGIVVSPDGTSAYAVNFIDYTVSMYSRNTTTGVLSLLSPATISAGAQPFRIAISPDSLFVYVTDFGAGTITAFSRNVGTGLLTVLGTTGTGTAPEGIAISPDGKSLYVANWGDGTISMYSRNIGTGSLTPLTPSTIFSTATGNSVRSISVSPDGTSVYATNYHDATVSMYSRNTSTGLLTALSPATISVSGYADGISSSPDGNSVYVTSNNTNLVYMFSRNVGTGALAPMVTPTVTSGSSPVGIILSPDGSTAYVANSVDNTISAYSRSATTGILTPFVAAPVSTGVSTAPMQLAISSDGTTLYAVDSTPAKISMFNLKTGRLVPLATPTIATGTAPFTVTISPDGTSVYVSDSSLNTVSMYSRDTSTGALNPLATPTIATGAQPNGITVSPDGTSVYVANQGANTVYMYSRNTSTGALSPLATPTIATGYNPSGITISPDGVSVYVTNLNSNTVSMYGRNASTGALTPLATPTIATGTQPATISISPDGNSAYVINSNSNTISMYSRNTSTGVLAPLATPTIATGYNPYGITISPDGTSVYVANYSSATVSMYGRNTSTGVLTPLATPTIAAGSYPYAIAISPDGTSIYVTNAGSALVSMFSRNLSTGVLTTLGTPNVATGTEPLALTISPDGNSVYVLNGASATVSMFSRK